VLAIGAEKPYGATLADDLRFVATDVTVAVIQNSGHWIMEEQPAAAVTLIRDWIDTRTEVRTSAARLIRLGQRLFFITGMNNQQAIVSA
jgi:hypothetical protein